jgi:uncharacterized protein
MGSNVAEHDLKGGDEAAPDNSSMARPKTNAFFFGSAARPLFGLYGPPAPRHDLDHAVLLCGPVGHEYDRAHWGLRLLGDQLIDAGFHVMRFDYSCQGDSWGAFETASVPQWLEDIKTSLGELQDNANARHISIVGLRFGAALACAAATEIPVEHLVLCDPVLDGLAYVEHLRRLQKHLRETWHYAPVPTPGAAHEELLGYRYTAPLIQQIASVEIANNRLPRAERVSMVLSADDATCQQYRGRLAQNHLHGDMRLVSELGSWDAVDVEQFVEPRLFPGMRRALAELLRESA